jgi:hypothetical protein
LTSNLAGLTVDIVIDNYNYARFLAEAIESARAQTHRQVNVIVVDDGSDDDSREILRRYEDTVAVVLKENGGQASALNAGVDRCQGDVVVFLDADDVLHPEAAERVVGAFSADPDLVKAQFRMDVIDADGQPTGEVKPPRRLPMPAGDLRAAELAFPFDLAWLPTSGNAFRATAIRRVLPIPEQAYRICADWYLVHTVTLLGTVASLDEICASYRVHGANSYQPQKPELDLDHLRQNILLARATSEALLELAAQLSLAAPDRILSLADLAARQISLKLAPESHPIAGDTRFGLLADALRATARRTNVTMPMKPLFVMWFAAMAVAPRAAATRLALLFLFPQTRPSFSGFRGRLQRG